MHVHPVRFYIDFTWLNIPNYCLSSCFSPSPTKLDHSNSPILDGGGSILPRVERSVFRLFSFCGLSAAFLCRKSWLDLFFTIPNQPIRNCTKPPMHHQYEWIRKLLDESCCLAQTESFQLDSISGPLFSFATAFFCKSCRIIMDISHNISMLLSA